MIYPRENPRTLGQGALQHHLFFDTPADLSDLPGLGRAAPGSTAYCVETQDAYILSGSGVWEVQ